MSSIRPLATVAVLAAVGLFLVLKINEGGSGVLEEGYGLEPAEISMATADGSAEAPPFFAEPSITGADSRLNAPLAPPTFSDPQLDASTSAKPNESDLFAPADDQGPAGAEDLPPLPALPPMEGQPLPESLAPAGAAMAAGAVSLGAPGNASDPLPVPDSVPVARYGAAPPVDPASPPPSNAPPVYAPTQSRGDLEPLADDPIVDPDAALTGSESNGPTFESYTPSETTPLDFGAKPAADPSEADWQAAQAALSSGKLTEAHRLLSTWHGDGRVSGERRQEIDRLLGKLAGTLIYDSREHRLAPPHQVKPGETLETIAAKYQVPWQLLAKINGVSTVDGVTPGQTLKVVPGPFSAVVDSDSGEVVLMLGEKYAGRFPAKVNMPPGASTLRVESKAAGTQAGLVLSGAATPVTVGASAGRYGGAEVTLEPRDAAELRDILSVGSLVTIRR